MNKVNIRGIEFDNITKEEAISLISSRFNQNITTVVFTPNSEIIEECIENPIFKDIISEADILLPDGIGVIKASKILKTPLKEKVAGVEVGEELFKALRESSFFLLGGNIQSSSGETVAEKAKKELQKKYSCNIVGTMHGYFDKNNKENDDVIEKINCSGADVLYVCLGSPTQEKWICNNRNRLLNIKLFIALGGSLDIYSKETKRAPKLFIKFGLEWLWRLLSQPSRIGRIMKLPKFYIGTLKYAVKTKTKKTSK